MNPDWKLRLAISVICLFALVACGWPCDAQTVPAANGAGGALSLRTEDGLELQLGRAGVAGILLDSNSIAHTNARSGLWVQDYQTSKGSPIPAVSDGQSIKLADLNLQAEAHYRSVGKSILIEGSVESTVPRKRAINVIFGLPVGGQDLRWWDNIDSERPVQHGGTSFSTYPFSALTDSSKSVGIGIAIPPDSPCDFSLGYDSEFGLHVEIRLGLSPQAGGNLRNRAAFKLLVYRVDPRWGFRDAVKRYYDSFPAVFESRTNKEGLWLASKKILNVSQVQDPQLYAFREGGPTGVNEDERLGILTFPYMIVGQRELTHLPSLPRTNGDATRMLEEYGRTANDSGNVPEQMEVIQNSALRDINGQMTPVMRNTTFGGNSMTFPVNASPFLYADTNKETVAKQSLGTMNRLMNQVPALSGFYIDSLAAWSRFEDFDPNHFAYEHIPLSYDNATGEPMISSKNSQQEFLDYLAGLLHSKGKLLFCNGTRPGLEFNAFACDVLGVEGTPDVQHLRTIAYQKPALSLLQSTESIGELEKSFKFSAALGIFTSVWYPESPWDAYSELLHKYVPMLQAITSAGWEPVTYAQFTDPAVHVERFGPKNNQLYFTLYNTASSSRGGYLKIEKAALKISACRGVTEVMSGAKFASLDDIKIQEGGSGLAVIECSL